MSGFRFSRMVVVLALGPIVAAPAAAQSGREALLLGNRAYGLADFEAAIALLSRGLDPSATPRDKLWLDGVQMLAHALLERNQAPLADAWLRWALRLEPAMALDSVTFPPNVWVAFSRAQVSTGGTPPDTAVAQTTWVWSPTPAAGGSLLVRSAGPPLTIRLENGEVLGVGASKPLAPGSYAVLGAAAGYQPARVSFEVLPGVATQVLFRLREIPPGVLYVASRPWGAVFLDGERIGYTTVAAHSVSAGMHRLRIERAGFAPFDTTIFVNQNQQVRLGPVRLEARPQ